ncbi:MAG: glycoside hydrolase family 25 protein [Candidatus Cloacimonetes bacterium]|nr:glycoside hydrolase family 25 protein [Candidatus Cloacimonadota bacterium]
MPIFGVDVSHWQGAVDWNRVYNEGFRFAFCKCTEGSGFRDNRWPSHRNALRNTQMIWGAYHYVNTSSPAAQAANCKAHLGDTSIPVALDWEANGGNVSNLRNVLAAFKAAGLRVPLLYAPRWYWSQVGGGDLAGMGVPLWASRYVTTDGTASQIYNSVPSSYWAAYGGLSPSILQFSSSANVAGFASMDVNAYLGDIGQLRALIYGGATPAPTPTPTPTPTRQMTNININQLNLRYFSE